MSNPEFDRDLKELVRAFSRGATTRRDFLRVSAISAGALALLGACGGGSDDEGDGEVGGGESAQASPAQGQATTAASTLGGSPASTTGGSSEGGTTAGTASIITQAEGEELVGVELSLPWKTFGAGVVVDPQRSTNWGPFWFMLPFAFGGLVQFDENAIVQPDLAERWEKSEDGLTYTFYLRDDAKFASGREVTADDFVYSWKRALDPENSSPMLHFMEHLKGHKEYNEGTADEIEGVKVVDPKTIELTLTRPYNFFLSYLGTFVWYIVDREVVEEFGDDFSSHPAGTGPWQITKVDPQLVVEMEPNPNYYGGVNQSISKLKFPVLVGPQADNTALNLFKSGETAFTDIPISLLDAVKQDPALSENMVAIDPSGSIRSLAMNFKLPPFDDVRVRRAFGHAIDRETFGKVIWCDTWVPAEFYTPKVVLNSDPGYEPPAEETPKFDPEKGQQLLEEAGYPNGEGLPEIRMYVGSENSSDEINRWRAFVGMFKEHLNVEVILDTSLTQDQITTKQEEEGLQMDMWWWGNITETPQLMSEVFRSDSPYNTSAVQWKSDIEAKGGYDPGADSKKFDELMAQADVEQDIDKMNDLYREGEALVLKNAVYVPVANAVPHLLVQPWIKNMRIGWWNFSVPVRFEPDVAVVEH